MRDDQLCPVEILFADKAELSEELLSQPMGSKVVLIGSRDMIQRLGYMNLVNMMDERYQLTWIDTPIANPTQLDVMDAVIKIGKEKPEIQYAIGGGSVIDTAKGISALYDRIDAGATIEEVTESIQSKSYQQNPSPIPIVAIPTTAGTGSEVTKWATIWDYQHTAKFSIDMPQLYPKKAIIVTEITMTLPKRLVLSTALDAMAHAIEAYWSKQTSPIVQDLSMMAISKIHTYLPIALNDLWNHEAREELCRASLLAGISFSNTRTTACHSISYPITMRYGVEHGFAVAMLLAKVSQVNLHAMPGIKKILQIFQNEGGLGAWIDQVSEGIQTLRLSAFGIQKEDLKVIVDGSFTQGRMNNNPVDLSPEQVEEILEQVL